MMEEARIQYSGFVGDVVALAQSYALEIRKDGRVPLYHFSVGPDRTKGPLRFAQIDLSLEAVLLLANAPSEEWPNVRVPFFVNDPAGVVILVGDQWWQYDFSPGKTYGDRAIPNPQRAATPRAAQDEESKGYNQRSSQCTSETSSNSKGKKNSETRSNVTAS